MDEYEFEDLVADLWEKQGWDTEATSNSNDGGVDVIAEKETPFNKKEVIQAKRHAPDSTVGRPAIQRMKGAKEQRDDVDTAVVVTTNEFSLPAKEAASNLNIKLVNGEGLISIIDGLKTDSILDRYINIRTDKKCEQIHSTKENLSHSTKENLIKKLDKNIQLSMDNPKINVYSIIFLHSSNSGYFISPQYDDCYYVHGFSNELNAKQNFGSESWKKIKSTANRNNLKLLRKRDDKMYVGRKNAILEPSRMLDIMQEFVSEVFSDTLQNAEIQIYAPTSPSSKSEANNTDRASDMASSKQNNESKEIHESESAQSPDIDRYPGTFPWFDYSTEKWKVVCPYCKQSVHNHPESFVDHWSSSRNCPGPEKRKPRKLKSVSDKEWKNLYKKLDD